MMGSTFGDSDSRGHCIDVDVMFNQLRGQALGEARYRMLYLK